MNWIDVNDKLPDPLKEVLCTNGALFFIGYRDFVLNSRIRIGWHCINTNRYDGQYCYDTGLENFEINVTHWCEIPELLEAQMTENNTISCDYSFCDCNLDYFIREEKPKNGDSITIRIHADYEAELIISGTVKHVISMNQR
jgi:hypothetical protein